MGIKPGLFDCFVCYGNSPSGEFSFFGQPEAGGYWSLGGAERLIRDDLIDLAVINDITTWWSNENSIWVEDLLSSNPK
jgi:hypothetical protein